MVVGTPLAVAKFLDFSSQNSKRGFGIAEALSFCPFNETRKPAGTHELCDTRSLAYAALAFVSQLEEPRSSHQTLSQRTS